MSQQTQEQINQAIDNKFVALMLEIEKRYQAPHYSFQKYEKIRIEQWCKKLCMVTQNLQWKKNRNLYAMLLLDQILNKKLIKPFIKMPTDDSLPVLSPAEVKALLSDKFKKFQARLDCENATEKLLNEGQDECQQISVQKYSYNQEQKERAVLRNQTTNTSYQSINKEKKSQIRPHEKNNFIPVSKTPRMTEQNVQTQTYQKTQNQRSISVSNTSRDSSTHNHYNSVQIDQSQPYENLPPQQSLNTIKSILKHTTKQSKTKHNFALSPQSQSNQKKNIRFNPKNPLQNHRQDQQYQELLPCDDFLKINFHPSTQQENSFPQNSSIPSQTFQNQQPQQTTHLALMNNSELQAEVIKLKTDNEIMGITLKHLQEEMNMKSEIIRKQNLEISELREMVLNLQSENQRLKNQQSLQKLTQGIENKRDIDQDINQRVISPAKYFNTFELKKEVDQNQDIIKTVLGPSFTQFNEEKSLFNLQKPLPQSFQSKVNSLQNKTDPIEKNTYNNLSQPLKQLISPRLNKDQNQYLKTQDENDVNSFGFKNLIDLNDRQLQSFDEEFNKIFNNM